MKLLLGISSVVVALAALPAQAAPDTSDKCTYNGNGIQSNVTTARSCAQIGTGGVPESYGQPGKGAYAAIGNGYQGYVENASASTADNGWTNSASALTNAGNAVSASSSLVDGTLHGTIRNGGVAYTTGSGINTRISDVLTFSNTSGAAAMLTLGYSFDGFISPGPRTDTSPFTWDDGGFVFMQLGQPTAGHYGPIRFAGSGGYVDSGAISEFYAREGLGQRVFEIGASDYTFSGSYDQLTGNVRGTFSTSLLIPTGNSDLGFALTMLLDCRSLGVVCDFGHTGRFGLGALPAGLSFRSQSGVLLSGNGSTPPGTGAVPEPATWAMLIAGVGAVGGSLRRRHQKLVRCAA